MGEKGGRAAMTCRPFKLQVPRICSVQARLLPAGLPRSPDTCSCHGQAPGLQASQAEKGQLCHGRLLLTGRGRAQDGTRVVTLWAAPLLARAGAGARQRHSPVARGSAGSCYQLHTGRTESQLVERCTPANRDFLSFASPLPEQRCDCPPVGSAGYLFDGC